MVAPVSVARAQGLFNVAGGLWPLLSLRTFERVYGPKTDDWLQKASAGLLAASGLSMLRAAPTVEGMRHARRTGIGTALTFLAVDVMYVPRGRISPAYLMDVAKEITWLIAWARAGRLATQSDHSPLSGHVAARPKPGHPANGQAPLAVSDTDPHLLDVYLNDHFSGSTSGLALVRRMARVHRGRPLGPALEDLAEEVRLDRVSLRGTMSALGVRPRRGRAALGLVLERAGRLKLNGRLLSRSPLSDVIELEAMRLGVEGKEACWRSLRTLAPTDPRLDPDRFDSLIHRAQRQAQALETMHTRLVKQSLADGASPPPAGPGTLQEWPSNPRPPLSCAQLRPPALIARLGADSQPPPAGPDPDAYGPGRAGRVADGRRRARRRYGPTGQPTDRTPPARTSRRRARWTAGPTRQCGAGIEHAKGLWAVLGQAERRSRCPRGPAAVPGGATGSSRSGCRSKGAASCSWLPGPL
ncbi:hypothetical protein ABZO31_00330 [Streptomyces sp. HUAS MG47]|uniref:hypothetical protein n=1 Tax=Streptomyces solicamelliae TaxID=3231716 RepID=UPI0038780CA5